MGFEGIPRPSQLLPHSNPLNPYTADNRARTWQAKVPKIKATGQDEGIEATEGEEQNPYPDTDEENGKRGTTFSGEEAEEIRLMARVRGLMNVSLDSGVRYEFHVNAATGLVDLVVAGTGELVLQLTPDELMQLSSRIERYAGMLTDRSG